MKKIEPDKIKLQEILDEHFSYCCNVLDKITTKNSSLPILSDKEKKDLFIHDPFDGDKLKNEYITNTKYTQFNFTEAYKHFRKYKKTKWCGWKLIQSLEIDVCPYCGQQYMIIAMGKNKTIAEATLDHYLPKEKYKYLALNFYNLIPVCKNCNSSYKGISEKLIINPHFFSYGENIKFEIENLDIVNYLDKDKVFKLKITNISKDKMIHNLVDKHTDVLCIKERYEHLQNIIKSLILKKQAYETSGNEKLINFMKYIQAQINGKDIEDILLCSDLITSNEPLNKFKKDIWRQLSS